MTLGEFFYASSHASAYLAVAATAIVGYGFVRLAFKHSGLVGHLAMGLLLMHTAMFVRTLYWDGLRNVVPKSAWDQWYVASNGTAVNLVFNVMVILAGYHSLKALKLAIPEEIRGQYSLLGAAFYPRLRILDTLRRAIIALWNRVSG